MFPGVSRGDQYTTLVRVGTATHDQTTMFKTIDNFRNGGLAEMHSFGKLSDGKGLRGWLDKQLEQRRLRAGKAGPLNELSRMDIEGANYPPQGE